MLTQERVATRAEVPHVVSARFASRSRVEIRSACDTKYTILFAVYRKLAESVQFCLRKVDFPALLP